jgi:two-component system, chemotaxis family, chemotaxis protein CheY
MTSPLKVLIVEDYDSMRALVQRYLERSGYAQVSAVRSPHEALSLTRSERFDLIISDHEMPGMNGLEFLAAIRADPKTHGTRFIMLTCSDDRELVRQAIALGADEYHTKPIAQQTLEKSVRRLERPLARRPKSCVRDNARDLTATVASFQAAQALQMCAAA